MIAWLGTRRRSNRTIPTLPSNKANRLKNLPRPFMVVDDVILSWALGLADFWFLEIGGLNKRWMDYRRRRGNFVRCWLLSVGGSLLVGVVIWGLCGGIVCSRYADDSRMQVFVVFFHLAILQLVLFSRVYPCCVIVRRVTLLNLWLCFHFGLHLFVQHFGVQTILSWLFLLKEKLSLFVFCLKDICVHLKASALSGVTLPYDNCWNSFISSLFDWFKADFLL